MVRGGAVLTTTWRGRIDMRWATWRGRGGFTIEVSLQYEDRVHFMGREFRVVRVSLGFTSPS